MRFLEQVIATGAVALMVAPALGQVSETPDPLFQDEAPLRVTISRSAHAGISGTNSAIIRR